MEIYEPELMYALDSLNEYSDWKNIYNVSGNDICYCPICLGRVKLWNGQDPNKTYLKQRCFHHIDGMCSKESKIHFAYKNWLLEKGCKFKVEDDIYEVESAKLEIQFNTSYGNYRPDIVVNTTNNKTFYVEVAYTNKKTDDYVLKWDELGIDVIEIDVNEQLFCVKSNDIPVFKIIYSSDLGQCFIKKYIRQDYDELFSERKIYWKRNDLINYKIKWEQLDWFWRDLQKYYSKKLSISEICETFEKLDFEDQKFICTRFKNGKHKVLKYELEKHYSDKKELEKVRLQHISQTIRQLNREFGYSSTYDKVYLCRKGRHVIFRDHPNWEKRSYLFVTDNITENDIYNFFHPIMKLYYKNHEKHLLEQREKELKIKQIKIEYEEKINKLREKYDVVFQKIKNEINNCKNYLWCMSFSFNGYHISNYTRDNYIVLLRLAKYWEKYIYLEISEIEDYLNSHTNENVENSLYNFIISELEKEMNTMLKHALVGKSTVRLLEVK